MNNPFPIRHIHFRTLIIAGLLIPAHASELDTPHTFSSGTPAIAAEVNENFMAAEDAINDNDNRLTSVESTLSDIVTRLETLESAGPSVTVDTYFATDLVFLMASGNLTIPNGVDGNQTEAGNEGDGSVGIDGRSTGDYPGRIKATLFTIY